VLSVKRGGEWIGVTSTQFLDEVKAVAKGIIANGVAPGERIAVMSRNRYEWTVVDYAIWYAGAASVPVYETSSAEQVQWILSDSGSVAVFLESHRHKAVYDEVAVDIPSCTRVWVFDDGIIDELKREGASVSDDELEARRRSLTPDSLATLIYTSGTTGRPKGCMLTQGNLMFEVDNVVVALNEVFRAPGSSTLLFLPIAHVFGRLIQLGCLRARPASATRPTSRICCRSSASSSPRSCSRCRAYSRRSTTRPRRRRMPTARGTSSRPRRTPQSSTARPSGPAGWAWG